MTSRSLLVAAALMLLASGPAVAHNLSESNAAFVAGLSGPAVGAFLYLGAKHMVTGYDHLLFLLGVVFFLARPRDVLIYVSLFTLGHSLTLITGVLAGWNVNAYLVDTVIGLSVVYKAFENLGGLDRAGRLHLDTRLVVFLFGLCHGLGLATKLQALALHGEGLVANMLSFNVGVEIGQVLGLALILLLLLRWRASPGFERQAFVANTVLMTCGFLVAGQQLTALVLYP